MYVGVGPPPPPARQVGQPQPKAPSRHGDQGGGGGGVGQMGFRATPPPPAEQFSSRPVLGAVGCPICALVPHRWHVCVCVFVVGAVLSRFTATINLWFLLS